jgi:hypothetical protein
MVRVIAMMMKQRCYAVIVAVLGATILVSCPMPFETPLLQKVKETVDQYNAASENHTVATPQFSPSAGTFSADQSVSITDDTPGAAIHYTSAIDGTTPPDPTAASTLYSSPVPVAGNGTTMIIKAIAVKPGMSDSSVVTATYAIIYDQVSSPLFAPPSGTYSSDQNVTITDDTPGTEIHYTSATGGATPPDPTAASTPYSSPISVAGNGTTMTIKAIAMRSGMTDSDVIAAIYSINYLQVSTPEFAPLSGNFATGQTVTITTQTTGASIRSTRDGTTPSETVGIDIGSGGPVEVAYSQTLKAIAYKSGMLTSTVGTAAYVIRPGTPTGLIVENATAASLGVSWDTLPGQPNYQVFRDTTAGGSFSSKVFEGADIGFTDTGLDPLTTYFYKVRATNAAGDSPLSSPVSASTTSMGKVSAVTIAPPSGTYSAAQTISMNTPTPGAAIYYTTNGSTPDAGSNVYSAPFTLYVGSTIKALAKKSGYDDSDVVSATYTLVGHSVLYAANGATGGTVPVDASTYVQGATVTVLGNSGALTKEGNAWNGWNTAANGSGTTYAQGQTFVMGPADMTLYARWLDALWVRSVVSSSDGSYFKGVSVDSSGNIYAAGGQSGTGSFSYGTGVSAAGPYSSNLNAVVVKYNNLGEAQWAAVPTAGGSASFFYSTAVDSSGNIFAVGIQDGTGTFTYGTGVNATASYIGDNAVIVKYNASGIAQWARTVSAGSNISTLQSVAVDASGNAYAVGYQVGNGVYTYGTGVSASGPSLSYNIVIVKYNSSGTAVWAKSIETGPESTRFNGLALDASGNIYAVGYQTGTQWVAYAPYVGAGGTSPGYNVLLVKYNPSGIAQWARTLTGGTSTAQYYTVAVDGSGNIYAGGTQDGTGTYSYGTGVSATGVYSSSNDILVKYNSAGTAQWATTPSTAPGLSQFSSLAVDPAGNVYAAGFQGGGEFTYGTGVAATGPNSTRNVALVKYSPAGTARWAKTAITGSSFSVFWSVAIDGAGDLVAAGWQRGTSLFTYGSGVSAAGSFTGENPVLVKYPK